MRAARSRTSRVKLITVIVKHFFSGRSATRIAQRCCVCVEEIPHKGKSKCLNPTRQIATAKINPVSKAVRKIRNNLVSKTNKAKSLDNRARRTKARASRATALSVQASRTNRAAPNPTRNKVTSSPGLKTRPNEIRGRAESVCLRPFIARPLLLSRAFCHTGNHARDSDGGKTTCGNIFSSCF